MNKCTKLFSLLILIFSINQLLGQDKLNTKLLTGRWRLENVKNESNSIIDFTFKTKGMTEIFDFMTFKERNVDLQWGKSKCNGKWDVVDHTLTFNFNNHSPISYNIATLTSDTLLIELKISPLNIDKMTIKMFYKKM
ncbi:MAG: lipocalin family protein [Saprospiraceae bacterium]